MGHKRKSLEPPVLCDKKLLVKETLVAKRETGVP